MKVTWKIDYKLVCANQNIIIRVALILTLQNCCGQIVYLFVIISVCFLIDHSNGYGAYRFCWVFLNVLWRENSYYFLNVYYMSLFSTFAVLTFLPSKQSSEVGPIVIFTVIPGRSHLRKYELRSSSFSAPNFQRRFFSLIPTPHPNHEQVAN